MASRMDKVAKEAKATERENAKMILERAKELGLEYQNEELPPDELDEDQYKKGLAYSLLSMIPYTQAWYEGFAAEEEMDDLAKIHIERSKCDDLVSLTKMGRHKNEEALQKMMKETNHDFFYFNKLRTKMEAEGQIEVRLPDLNPFKDLEHGKNKNRLYFSVP
jgi:hypothetical protein